jgi:hypothetical protein
MENAAAAFKGRVVSSIAAVVLVAACTGGAVTRTTSSTGLAQPASNCSTMFLAPAAHQRRSSNQGKRHALRKTAGRVSKTGEVAT